MECEEAESEVRNAGFTEFYRANVDDVFRYCVYRLDSREAAEDATSDIFARAFASFDSWSGNGSRRSWLFSIAHNAVVDVHRRARPVVSIDDLTEIEDDRSDPEAAALSATEQAEIRALLRELPESQRQILELRLAGLTGGEIAEVLGRTHAAVKIGQVRAYRSLRVLLQQQGVISKHESMTHGSD